MEKRRWRTPTGTAPGCSGWPAERPAEGSHRPWVRRAARSATMMRVPTQYRSRGAEIVDGAPVPVAVVASRTEAELIVGMLRSNGLRAAVSADDAGGVEPQLQLQGVRVLVAAADEAAARQLIAEADETPA